jgi:hypothetical protein
VVVANYNGDTSFLYQTNRIGFPNVPLPIDELISKFNVSYYIATAKDDQTNMIMKKYTPLVDEKDYVIVDLTKPNQSLTAPQ